MSEVIFSQQQRDQIRARLEQGSLPGVNYSDAYSTIADWLSDLGAEDVRCWFRGAAQANSGSNKRGQVHFPLAHK